MERCEKWGRTERGLDLRTSFSVEHGNTGRGQAKKVFPQAREVSETTSGEIRKNFGRDGSGIHGGKDGIAGRVQKGGIGGKNSEGKSTRG